MTMFLFGLLLFVWGIALVVAWVWAAINVLILTSKPNVAEMRNVAISSLFISAVIASPFLLEGVGEIKYVFNKDGTLSATIQPQVMSQGSFNAVTDGKIVVGESLMRTGPDASIKVSVGDKMEARIGYWWDNSQDDLAIVPTISAAIKSGIKLDNCNEIIENLITHNATNELASIREKVKSVAYNDDNRTSAIAQADMASTILHGLGPAMARYNVYPKNVSVYKY